MVHTAAVVFDHTDKTCCNSITVEKNSAVSTTVRITPQTEYTLHMHLPPRHHTRTALHCSARTAGKQSRFLPTGWRLRAIEAVCAKGTLQICALCSKAAGGFTDCPSCPLMPLQQHLYVYLHSTCQTPQQYSVVGSNQTTI